MTVEKCPRCGEPQHELPCDPSDKVRFKSTEMRLVEYVEIKMGSTFYLKIQDTPHALHTLKECIQIFLESDPRFNPKVLAGKPE